MKIATILGTRPELIRLSTIIPKLDKCTEHIFVHTGQNYDSTLNDIFFQQLGIRKPNYQLNTQSQTAIEQIGKILIESEKIFSKEKPDKILILGDTNSGLTAFVAKRMGIPVYHMEAGNRCYDDRVPEEVNRRVIDHSSDILLPYTEGSRYNLLKEGIRNNRIFVTGNPITEVLNFYDKQIEDSTILNHLNLKKGKYFLVTMHRAENVDIPERLDTFLQVFSELHKKYKMPVICSTHPRTKSKLKGNSLPGVLMEEPFGLFDFVNLEKNAFCVLTDSGTVQEECCIFNIPNVTIRDVTERPETIEAGSNIISGCDSKNILSAVEVASSTSLEWNPPHDYQKKNVTDTVLKILMSSFS